MRVVCVWRRESEYGRALEEWIMEFERRTGREVESLEPDDKGMGNLKCAAKADVTIQRSRAEG